MAKTKKAEEASSEVVPQGVQTPKEQLILLLKAKVASLFDREPQPGMSDSKLSQLADDIIELIA